MADTNLTRQQNHYLNLIERSARSLLLVINDIFDVSTLERGGLVIQNVKFPLAEIIEDTWQNFASAAAEKGLELTYYIAPSLLGKDLDGKNVMAMGDPLRLAQILSQILGNAIKFTKTGSVELRVSLSENADTTHNPQICGQILTESSGDIPNGDNLLYIWFEFADTGIGIPEQFQADLFQSFTQADSTITRQYGGTGLGLSISKRLIELMGGNINVTSCEGVGSVFRFCLPMTIYETAITTDLDRQILERQRELAKDSSQVHSQLSGIIVLSPFAATRHLLQKCAADLRISWHGVEISDQNWRQKLPPVIPNSNNLVVIEGNLALSEPEIIHLRQLSGGFLVRLATPREQPGQFAADGSAKAQNFVDNDKNDVVLMRPISNRAILQIIQHHQQPLNINRNRSGDYSKMIKVDEDKSTQLAQNGNVMNIDETRSVEIAPIESNPNRTTNSGSLESIDSIDSIESTDKMENSGQMGRKLSLNILLAEDNWINQTVAQTILQNLGHRVTTANNGVEALAAMNFTRFDLVLMDLQMPELDGEAATRQIRSHNQYDNLPIIALTAHAYAELRGQLLEQGFDDYLAKPLNREDFAMIIAEWGNGRKKSTQNASLTQ